MVWLALDQSYDSSAPPDPLRPRYVALKIGTASRGQQEAIFLSELQALCQPHHQGESRHIITFLDYFQISGPNGSHWCLVTELLGPCVGDVHKDPGIEGPDLLPLPIARHVAVQCAEALAFLHSQGIVHADLYPRNLAFALTVDTNSWTVEQLYAALGGEPVKIPFQEAYQLHYDVYYSKRLEDDPSHRPEYLVLPPTVSQLWALCTTSEPSIRLIDLSESFRLPFPPGSHPLPGIPRAFSAPEILLKLPREVTSSIDIWALGCTIYSLIGRSSPLRFPGYLEQPYHSDYLALILILTGGKNCMPERLWKAFRKVPALGNSILTLREHYSRCLNWDYNLRDKDPESGGDEEMAPLETEDHEVLKAVIAAALVVDPARRAPARRILEIMREGWAVFIESDVLSADRPELMHDS